MNNIKEKDVIGALYDSIIEEQLTPLAVNGGDGTKPGDLPSDTSSPTETQKGTGAENAKGIKAPEEGEEKLSPVKKDKGTKKTASKRQVTTINDSTQPRKTFMELFDQVMIKEDDEGIESPDFNDDDGDFPETEEDIPSDRDSDREEMSEGDIYSQLSTLFGQLANIKGDGFNDDLDDGMDNDLDDLDDDLDDEVPPTESVRRRGHTISEMKSEPEPKELGGSISNLQAPRKLGGKGVKVSTGKAASRGSDKRHTGELEAGPEGMRHDKSKFTVKGTGSAHKGNNASFVED